MRSYHPYRFHGYRLYLYEDSAPTVSVVAETPIGFPYPGEPGFVQSVSDIMKLYVGRYWGANFKGSLVKTDYLMETIEEHHGSIGTPTANALGISTAVLRRKVEQWGLQEDVNRIRKRYGRRPAQLRNEEQLPQRYKILEIKLPGQYDWQESRTRWIS